MVLNSICLVITARFLVAPCVAQEERAGEDTDAVPEAVERDEEAQKKPMTGEEKMEL